MQKISLTKIKNLKKKHHSIWYQNNPLGSSSELQEKINSPNQQYKAFINKANSDINQSQKFDIIDQQRQIQSQSQKTNLKQNQLEIQIPQQKLQNKVQNQFIYNSHSPDKNFNISFSKATQNSFYKPQETEESSFYTPQNKSQQNQLNNSADFQNITNKSLESTVKKTKKYISQIEEHQNKLFSYLSSIYKKYSVAQFHQDYFKQSILHFEPHQLFKLLKEEILKFQQKSSTYQIALRVILVRENIIEQIKSEIHNYSECLISQKQDSKNQILDNCCKLILELRNVTLYAIEAIYHWQKRFSKCRKLAQKCIQEKQHGFEFPPLPHFIYYFNQKNYLLKLREDTMFLFYSNLNEEIKFSSKFDPFLVFPYKNLWKNKHKNQTIKPQLIQLLDLNDITKDRIRYCENLLSKELVQAKQPEKSNHLQNSIDKQRNCQNESLTSFQNIQFQNYTSNVNNKSYNNKNNKSYNNNNKNNNNNNKQFEPNMKSQTPNPGQDNNHYNNRQYMKSPENQSMQDQNYNQNFNNFSKTNKTIEYQQQFQKQTDRKRENYQYSNQIHHNNNNESSRNYFEKLSSAADLNSEKIHIQIPIQQKQQNKSQKQTESIDSQQFLMNSDQEQFQFNNKNTNLIETLDKIFFEKEGFISLSPREKENTQENSQKTQKRILSNSFNNKLRQINYQQLKKKQTKAKNQNNNKTQINFYAQKYQKEGLIEPKTQDNTINHNNNSHQTTIHNNPNSDENTLMNQKFQKDFDQEQQNQNNQTNQKANSSLTKQRQQIKNQFFPQNGSNAYKKINFQQISHIIQKNLSQYDQSQLNSSQQDCKNSLNFNLSQQSLNDELQNTELQDQQNQNTNIQQQQPLQDQLQETKQQNSPTAIKQIKDQENQKYTTSIIQNEEKYESMFKTITKSLLQIANQNQNFKIKPHQLSENDFQIVLQQYISKSDNNLIQLQTPNLQTFVQKLLSQINFSFLEIYDSNNTQQGFVIINKSRLAITIELLSVYDCSIFPNIFSTLIDFLWKNSEVEEIQIKFSEISDQTSENIQQIFKKFSFQKTFDFQEIDNSIGANPLQPNHHNTTNNQKSKKNLEMRAQRPQQKNYETEGNSIDILNINCFCMIADQHLNLQGQLLSTQDFNLNYDLSFLQASLLNKLTENVLRNNPSNQRFISIDKISKQLNQHPESKISEVKVQNFQSGRAFCGFTEYICLKNFHQKALKINHFKYEYFRIKITPEIQRYTWLLTSNISSKEMLILPTKQDNLFIFFLSASDFIPSAQSQNFESQIQKDSNPGDLFLYVRNYLQQYKEKQFVDKEIWIPMFKKKKNLVKSNINLGLEDKDKIVYESFEVSFLSGFDFIGGNMIINDPLKNNSILFKAPFIFGILHNQIDKIIPNLPLLTCLVHENDLIRGNKQFSAF